VPDAHDRCPDEAEDVDGDRDEDGCPDRDGDGDGVLDDVDRCPAEAEDADRFEDEDGCPEVDNDADGVPDADDACPLEAGELAERGCPAPAPPALVRVEGAVIRLEQRIEFVQAGTDLLESGAPILEALRALLEARPELRAIAIEGHSDGSGAANYNLLLSQRRAQSVARWLVEHGVAASRLRAWGCGMSRPLGPETSLEDQQQNRRVELYVVDPAPPEPRSTEGCSEAAVPGPGAPP